MSIKQVTVFGGSGFVGRAIVRALAQEGLRIRIACRRTELAESIKTAGDVGQITLMRTNLRFPDSVSAAIIGSEAVVNASGIPFQRGRQRYQSVHVDGARAIARAASAAGIQRLVHISGIGADHRNSTNRYVRSKVDAEDAVVSDFGSVTIVRPSVVFGPDDVMFNRMAQIAAKAPVLPVVGDGSTKVQPVFVGDVGAAVACILARPDTAKTVFELGGPRVYTYREIAALVLHQINRRKPIVGIPAAAMKFAAFFAEFLPVPPLTRDQVELLTQDNIARPGNRGLEDLGILPTAAEVILPTYLDRYRAGGRYNQQAPA